MTSPRTYSAATKLAEKIERTELEHLLTQSKSVTIFRPRRSLIHAYVVSVMRYGTAGLLVGYDYCNRNGYNAHNAITLYDEVVFDFYQLGRIVEVAR